MLGIRSTLLSHKRAAGRPDEVLYERHECAPATVIDGSAYTNVLVRSIIPEGLDPDLVRSARGHDEFRIVGSINEVEELSI